MNRMDFWKRVAPYGRKPPKDTQSGEFARGPVG